MTSPRRPLRIALIAVAAVILVGAGVAAIAIARFDPNAYKPEIDAAVRRATGRDLALNGKISLKPSLWPTIQAKDVAFSNPPGFSRPQMALLQGLELQLAVVPMLSGRIAIERLVLIRPDILLETNAAGQSNWQLTPQTSPSPEAGAQAPGKAPAAAKPEISIASVRVEDGLLAYRDDRTKNITTLGLSNLEASTTSPDSPLHIDANAKLNGAAVKLVGDTGSLTRLQDPAATTPWPAKLTLTVGTAKVTADGALTQPLQGRGYDLAISGMIPDASSLTPLLQGFVPPPLHDVSFAVRVADKGGAGPEFSALTLHVGPADLAARVPGLALDHLDVAAAAFDQPAKADAAGKLGNQPVSLTATTGPLAALLPNAKTASFPVDATLQAAGATVTAKGTIANAVAMTGARIVLAARIPDLSILSPLVGHPLPAVKQVALDGTLSDAPGGFHDGAALRGFTLTTADGDLAGDLAIGLATKASLTAKLKSNRIDLDALQAAVDQTPAAAPPSPTPQSAAPQPAPAQPAPGQPASDLKSPPATRPRHTERLFSDQPIPFGLLQAANADVGLTIADLHSGGTDYKAIDSHVVVTDGKLTVNPFTADIPGGHLSASAAVDASQAAPPVHVVLHAPGLALKTILAAAHEPSFASGNLEVYADLRGTGDSPHAIAASLDGSLGLAMAAGSIDNRLLGSLLGKVLDTMNALDLVGKGGDSQLRCFGLRMNAAHGVATIKPMALSSSLITMTGTGTVNLADETLSLSLLPQARIAGTGVVIPIEVAGPIRDPAVKVNKLGAAERNVGPVAGALIGDATPLGIVGGLLGADKLLGGSTDICTPALAAARGQPVPKGETPESAKPEGAKPGAVNAEGARPEGAQTEGAQAPGAKSPPAKPPALNPGQLLKNLLR